MTVPMAVGDLQPKWPLPAVTRRRWTFGASRTSKDGTKRRHAGVDLYAPAGSVVIAPEDGVVVATQRFLGPRAVALLLQTDSGPVILFGEIGPKSWEEFGLGLGSPIKKGQPVGRVGITPGGQSMLHFEMYRGGTRKNHRWLAGQAPPPQLLNPTQYLQAAAHADEVVPPEDDIIDPQDDPGHSHDPADPVDPIEPVEPVEPVEPIEPVDPIEPVRPHIPIRRGPSGLLVGALLGLALFSEDWD